MGEKMKEEEKPKVRKNKMTIKIIDIDKEEVKHLPKHLERIDVSVFGYADGVVCCGWVNGADKKGDGTLEAVLVVSDNVRRIEKFESEGKTMLRFVRK